MKQVSLLVAVVAILFFVSSCHPADNKTSAIDSSSISAQYNKAHGLIPNIYKPWWGDMTNWSQPYSKTKANTDIGRFVHDVFDTNPNIEVRSFFINADTLRSYLRQNPTVTDIQILPGLRDTVVSGTTQQYRVYYFIGVNANTKEHVYFKDQSGNDFVYENCLPCPSFCDRVGNNYLLE